MAQARIKSGAYSWPAPSPRIQELFRQGAAILLKVPDDWLKDLDQASLAAGEAINDPVLSAAARRINRDALIHWAAANFENPGEPVAPYISADFRNIARELVRVGASDLLFMAARSTQSISWQRWTEIVFTLTQDPRELHELITISGNSSSAYVDANMAGISEFMQAERDARARGTHADRRAIITRIMEGLDIDTQEASRNLGYTIDQAHHAAVIWSEESEVELVRLEKAAEAFVKSTGTRNSLIVAANASTLWVWAWGAKPIDFDTLRHSVEELTDVRIVAASAGSGMKGFRRAHLDALATQRLISRLRASTQVVHADSLSLIALMTHHMDSTQQFIAHTLGDLATADQSLRHALRIFLAAGCNATEAVEQAGIHRNTLLRKLESAKALLPRPLSQQRLHVAAALEVLYWIEGD